MGRSYDWTEENVRGLAFNILSVLVDPLDPLVECEYKNLSYEMKLEESIAYIKSFEVKACRSGFLVKESNMVIFRTFLIRMHEIWADENLKIYSTKGLCKYIGLCNEDVYYQYKHYDSDFIDLLHIKLKPEEVEIVRKKEEICISDALYKCDKVSVEYVPKESKLVMMLTNFNDKREFHYPESNKAVGFTRIKLDKITISRDQDYRRVPFDYENDYTVIKSYEVSLSGLYDETEELMVDETANIAPEVLHEEEGLEIVLSKHLLDTKGFSSRMGVEFYNNTKSFYLKGCFGDTDDRMSSLLSGRRARKHKERDNEVRKIGFVYSFEDSVENAIDSKSRTLMYCFLDDEEANRKERFSRNSGFFRHVTLKELTGEENASYLTPYDSDVTRSILHAIRYDNLFAYLSHHEVEEVRNAYLIYKANPDFKAQFKRVYLEYLGRWLDRMCSSGARTTNEWHHQGKTKKEDRFVAEVHSTGETVKWVAKPVVEIVRYSRRKEISKYLDEFDKLFANMALEPDVYFPVLSVSYKESIGYFKMCTELDKQLRELFNLKNYTGRDTIILKIQNFFKNYATNDQIVYFYECPTYFEYGPSFYLNFYKEKLLPEEWNEKYTASLKEKLDVPLWYFTVTGSSYAAKRSLFLQPSIQPEIKSKSGKYKKKGANDELKTSRFNKNSKR